jgi:hypothetical protein
MMLHKVSLFLLIAALLSAGSFWLGTTQVRTEIVQTEVSVDTTTKPNDPDNADRIDSDAIKPVPDFSDSTPFFSVAPVECRETNVSDGYACIFKYADTAVASADALAKKLITRAPQRLKELDSDPEAPITFEYGGSDFLTDLPDGVQMAQESRDKYLKGICGLDSMKIYGGSGMDLEQQACRYYYANQYLQILKRLEAGVSSSAN